MSTLITELGLLNVWGQIFADVSWPRWTCRSHGISFFSSRKGYDEPPELTKPQPKSWPDETMAEKKKASPSKKLKKASGKQTKQPAKRRRYRLPATNQASTNKN